MVWTGREVVIWGGGGPRCADGTSGACGDGAYYDPALDVWTPITTDQAPAPRSNHVAVWSPPSVLVWGELGAPPAENAILDGTLLTP